MVNILKGSQESLSGTKHYHWPGKVPYDAMFDHGDTLAVFNKDASELVNELSVNLELAIKKATTHVFPQRALLYQKRYMRRYMRNPRTLTTRVFSARVNALNGYLKQYPPFDQDQELTEEAPLDLLKFAVPKSWQKYMVLQVFDPVIHTTSEFVTF
jgi:hypothetical protein